MKKTKTLRAVVALFVMIAAAIGIGGQPAGAADPTGWLRVTTSPAVPTTVIVDGTRRDSWGLNWMKINPGAHEVCFTDVPGYATPGCETTTVSENAEAVVTGNFTQLGTIEVSTSPAVASTVSVDGVDVNDWGGDVAATPGLHDVCFGDVAGYSTPECQPVTVTAGATSSVTGTFTAVAAGSASRAGVALDDYGMLRVSTDPPVPTTISVDGVARSMWGLDWLKVTPGDHEVCFSGVPGFKTPSCKAVSVPLGGTGTLEDTFDRYGLLRVVVDPSVSTTISVGGVPMNDYGLWAWVEPNTFLAVCFGDVVGATPAEPCQIGLVAPGGTTVITETFTPAVVNEWTQLQGPVTSRSWAAEAVSANGLIVGDDLFCTGTCSETSALNTNDEYSAVTAVSDNGMIGGTLGGGRDRDPVLWTSATASPAPLAKPDGIDSIEVRGVNDSGVVIGTGRDTNDLSTKPLVWASPSATPSVLAVPSGYVAATATAVNNNGLIVGFGNKTGERAKPLAWTSSSAPAATELTMPADTRQVTPVDVNDSGRVIANGDSTLGYYATYNGWSGLGIVWDSLSGAPTTMALPTGFDQSSLTSVNASGAILGRSVVNGRSSIGDLIETNGTAMVWATPTGVPTNVVPPESGSAASTDVYPTGMTNGGVIVGGLENQDGRLDGWIWADPGSTPAPLAPITESAGYSSLEAVDANDSGVIVGTGYGVNPAGGSNSTYQGLVWSDAGAVPTVLAPLAGASAYPSVTVAAVDDDGAVLGGETADGVGTRPLYWASPEATPVALAVPEGTDNTIVTDMNDAGMITGATWQASSWKPLVWASPSASPTMLATAPGATDTIPVAVNASGAIAGFDFTGSGYSAVSRALMWASAASVNVLAMPTEQTSARATGIDDAGVVTGLGGTWTGLWSAAVGGAYDAIPPVTWATPGSTPQTLVKPSTPGSLKTVSAASNGTVVGVWGQSVFVWSSPSVTATETALPAEAGSFSVEAVTNSSLAVGTGTDGAWVYRFG